MPRYGSGKEDFDAEAAALRKRRLERQALVAKEEAYQRALAVTSGLESSEAAKRQSLLSARKEQAQVVQREGAVAGRSARDVNVDTEAIRRNTEARRRNAAVRAEQAKLGRTGLAVTGARDPAFPAAHRLAQEQGGTVTQYRIRQQLEGVGSRRASALQAAVEGGFRPQTAPAPAFAPLTRSHAAELELQRAKADLAQRTRDLARVVGGKSTPAEEAAALAARDSARARTTAAKAELSSANKEVDARAANAAAATREADAHNRAAQAAEKAPPPPPPPSRGADVIRHPTLYGTGAATAVDYSDAAKRAAGRYVPPSPPLRERGAAGDLYGGDPKYDEAYQRNRAAGLERERVASERAAEASRQHAVAVDQERIAQATLNAQRVDAYLERSTQASQRQAAAVRDSGVAFGTVSNAMHRHGALTTEFISAAARGETTLRELGNQSLATAGKFAGWTGAGAALYTAVDAVRQLGAGAVGASDGVAQLQRVVPNADRDQTIQAFSGLAAEFNVPIEVAADAVYRMGQRFHTVPEAVEAARSALYSFKTGEVDVATSTENLLAIVSGFGLEAKELTSVYDQVNEAQNRFGVKIGQTEAGLAKAAGAFRNSGGDLNFLLGLFVAINRATNRSGQEIGTGLARGVSQIRLPSHQESLRAAGVDVDPENLQETIKSALQVSQQPGADVNAIASGILGNQYARLLAPVLKDQTTLNEALRETAPAAAQGSAQKELERVLSQVSEQAKAVGVGLQNIGAELARSGALLPFAGALKALNLMLDAAGALLGAFNVLPSPLRETVAVLGQMAVLVAGLRKFGATDRLAGGPLGFLAQPDKRLKTHAVKGLRDAQQESFRELESAARREYTAAAFADRERRAVSDFERTPAFTSTRNLPIEDERRQIADSHHVALQQRATAAETARVQAMDETRRASAGATAAERDLKAVRAVPPAQIRPYLSGQGTAVPAQLDAPSTRGTRRIAPDGSVSRTPIPLSGRGFADIDRLTPRAPVAALPRVDRAATAARVRIASMAVTMEQLGRAHRGLGPSARLLEASAQRVVTGTAAAATSVAGAARGVRSSGGGIRRLGSSMASFARSLGPLEIAFIGYLALEGITSQTDKLSRDVDTTNKFLDDYTGKSEAQRTKLRDVAAKAAKPRGIKTTVEDSLRTLGDSIKPENLFDPESAKTRVLATLNPASLIGLSSEKRKKAAARAAREEAELKAREDRQLRAVSRGEPRTELVASDLVTDIERTSRDRSEGLISLADFDRQMLVYAQEAKALLDPSKAEGVAVKSTLARALSARTNKGGGQRYGDLVKTLDIAGVEAEMEGVIGQIEAAGGTTASLSNLTQLYVRATQLLGGKSDADSIKKLNDARKQTFAAIEANAQEEVRVGLQSATSEAGRQNVYSRVIGGLSNTRDELRERQAAARTRLNRAYAERRALRQVRPTTTPVRPGVTLGADIRDPISGSAVTLGALPVSNGQALQRRARKLAADIRKFKQNVRRFQNELNAANRELARIAGMMREEAFADRSEGRAINLAYDQSLTTDPVRRAALATLAAAREAKDAQRTFGKGRRSKQAQTAVNEARIAEADARQQAADSAAADAKERADKAAEARQDAVERVRLLGELAVARAGGDSVAAARAQVTAARAALQSAGSGNERLQALIDLTNANNALEDALVDRENARLDLLASATEDPVKQANYKRRQAANDLKNADPGTDRLQKKAAYNRSVQDFRNAQVQDKREDIDFQVQMGRITTDTAADLVDALARTKNLSKKAKRDLLLEAKRLRDEASGDYELNLDSLRLPSLYEIRRAVTGGQQGVSVTNQYRTEINVSDPQSALQVGAQMEEYHAGSMAATARAMGVGGGA